ncbi:protein phosphatase 2C domain-containing protein [Actinoplanes sp. LDG1-06]|uniref:Protein phosphatase 2C domain-containing protein n=1 Tax=Paractinoplanes ovalisporus TaxID=2810368 RepID=A0ABS2APT8_9ACTN|nr:protein phosphatase 2C domain-containing protein [Actinoplanes ovalisporus]MBM2621383.1 protein phosphatase 2C domain-containing protein [Actinoplanes ovalisporus]
MEITKVAWTAAGRRLTAAAGSVVGERYHDNYDVLHLDPGVPLAVVADGMGDGPGSTIAGSTAVEVFVRSVLETPVGDAPSALRAAVTQAQDSVRQAGRTLDELTGCTLTAFVSAGDASAWIVQLGDSRAYRLRDGLLDLLTVDHTIAWLGILNGWFAADSDEARAARYRLTRYAGHPDAPEPDLMHVTLHPGDVYLLCTDGVSDQLTYERLTRVLATDDPGATVHALLDDTLTAGGRDNATAVVIRVERTVL